MLCGVSARKFVKKQPAISGRQQRKRQARRAKVAEAAQEGGTAVDERERSDDESTNDEDHGAREGKRWKKTRYLRRHRHGTDVNKHMAALLRSYEQAWDPAQGIFDLNRVKRDTRFIPSFMKLDKRRSQGPKTKTREQEMHAVSARDSGLPGATSAPHAHAKKLLGLQHC